MQKVVDGQETGACDPVSSTMTGVDHLVPLNTDATAMVCSRTSFPVATQKTADTHDMSYMAVFSMAILDQPAGVQVAAMSALSEFLPAAAHQFTDAQTTMRLNGAGSEPT